MLAWNSEGWFLFLIQIATALVLVRALYNPLSVHSSLPGYCAPIVWAWPGIKRVQQFLKSCGPVFGTLLVKTTMYSSLTALATGLSPVHSGAHHVVMCKHSSVAIFSFCSL